VARRTTPSDPPDHARPCVWLHEQTEGAFPSRPGWLGAKHHVRPSIHRALQPGVETVHVSWHHRKHSRQAVPQHQRGVVERATEAEQPGVPIKVVDAVVVSRELALLASWDHSESPVAQN
jgi:hypothetical protein